MSRYNTIGKVATKVTQHSDLIVVKYHQTNVVTITPTRITLNTGGWQSATTKLRMNQASNQYNLGYSVYQKDYCFHVRINGKDYPFSCNRLEIDRETGKVFTPICGLMVEVTPVI